MQTRYLGDSFDIVKQSLLRWLRSYGDWSAHPMFTGSLRKSDVAAYESIIGAKVISAEILTIKTNRSAYLACACSCDNLFLDPDTGLRMQPTRGAKAPKYIFADELLWLAEKRSRSLTVVFDQCIGRGSERVHLEKKLRGLCDHGLFGFAYISHACFVVTSRDRRRLEQARATVISESRLPESRFLPIPRS